MDRMTGSGNTENKIEHLGSDQAGGGSNTSHPDDFFKDLR
jgi:hypothetical protein